MDENGINKLILSEEVAATIKEKAKFILYNGDLVLGYTTEDGFRSQLQDWIKIMQPLYDAGIHVYPVRGNHDAFSKGAVKVWNEIFSGPYALPQNGPAGERNMTFAARESNALILGVDQFGTHEHAVNQAWVNRLIAANKLPLIFVLGHEMAFKAGHHDDNLDNNVAARDTFILSLANAGCRVYFAGHDHFYDHMEIKDPVNHPGFDLHQLVVGTAGAPFYKGDAYDGHNGSWQLTHVTHIEDTFGYVLVEVNGRKVTLTWKGRVSPGVYKAGESWSYTVPVK